MLNVELTEIIEVHEVKTDKTTARQSNIYIWQGPVQGKTK